MIESFERKYRWLSNFSRVKIVLEGIEYATVEHAYMSAKSKDMAWKSRCADAQLTPAQIKRESRQIEVREDWDDIKYDIMKECIEQKYNQEPYKTLLKNTGKKHIQEGNTWNDEYWGVNLETGEGENKLGKLIMKKRNKL